jgi:hypothetical protein
MMVRYYRFVLWGTVGIVFGPLFGGLLAYIRAGKSDDREGLLVLFGVIAGSLLGPIVGLAVATAFDWFEYDRREQPPGPSGSPLTARADWTMRYCRLAFWSASGLLCGPPVGGNIVWWFLIEGRSEILAWRGQVELLVLAGILVGFVFGPLVGLLVGAAINFGKREGAERQPADRQERQLTLQD